MCDDMTNTKVCNFDGGDCCLPLISTLMCYNCVCKNPLIYNVTFPVLTTTEVLCPWPHLLNNNHCDHEAFIEECDMDGDECGNCLILRNIQNLRRLLRRGDFRFRANAKNTPQVLKSFLCGFFFFQSVWATTKCYFKAMVFATIISILNSVISMKETAVEIL